MTVGQVSRVCFPARIDRQAHREDRRKEFDREVLQPDTVRAYYEPIRVHSAPEDSLSRGRLSGEVVVVMG